MSMVLLADLKEPDQTDEQKRGKIAQSLREFLADALNLAQFLIQKNTDPDTMRMFMEDAGVSYDGKSKKFK